LLKDKNYKFAHPSHDHFFPLIAIAGMMKNHKVSRTCDSSVFGLSMGGFLFE
jgi:hypothetical protein